ncbi:MAG: hypothetical protein U0903_12170 [Planctomycetales bacterium]
MSYRTFKRLLGETSLERKCRFLFGGGLLLLILGSFYFYGLQTSQMVYDQNRITGRLLVAPIIYGEALAVVRIGEPGRRFFPRHPEDGGRSQAGGPQGL